MLADNRGFNQKLRGFVLSPEASVFLLHSRRGENDRAPLIPRRGTRPVFVAGVPVQLRRLALSPEPGASAGRFFFTPTGAFELKNNFCCNNHSFPLIYPPSYRRAAVGGSPLGAAFTAAAACFVFEPP